MMSIQLGFPKFPNSQIPQPKANSKHYSFRAGIERDTPQGCGPRTLSGGSRLRSISESPTIRLAKVKFLAPN
jgi:hypothetical protein